MNKEKTVLIMAAGMGSRFGGLKQMEPVGPSGEFIVDYSIYDAKEAGFTKVVFVIKQENEHIFRETVGKRVEKEIEVAYAYQRLEDIPPAFPFPEGREKPWGTSHAILSAKDLIDGPFIVINADDFYGRDAFQVASNFIDQLPSEDQGAYGMVAYQIKNTLTENGSVKRGICDMKDGYLTQICESSVVETNGIITASPLDGSPAFVIPPEKEVSMNLFIFTPSIFTYIEDHFLSFLEKNKENPFKCEYLIPETVTEMITKQIATVKVLKTSAKWHGMTYKEDKQEVVNAIQALIDEGCYPENLWKKL